VFPSRPILPGSARVATLGAVIAVGVPFALAGPASAAAPPAQPSGPGAAQPDSSATPDVVDAPVPAGPPAAVAWTEGRRVRVSAPGSAPRTVARLGRVRPEAAQLSLSRDGRHLVVVGDEGTTDLPIAAGGRPVRLADSFGEGASGVRWSPDSRRLLLVQGSIVRCAVEPTASCTPTGVTRAVGEFGASWSPDGTRFAYIRSHRSKTAPDTELGDLVTVPATGQGATQVVERAVFGTRERTYPTPPVWTRAGLAFTVYGERVSASGADGEPTAVGPSRVRTRILGPDGRVRTLTAAAPGRGELLPFLASADSPSGRLLGLQAVVQRGAGTDPDAPRLRFALRTLGSDGSLAPYGVSFADHGSRTDEVLGVLADGRVAVRTIGRGGFGPASLRFVTPGAPGRGATVAKGSAVSAAVAYPNDALSF
jgi:dipeptidyl aminopeptidase/acylaminoacyl peptidase